MEAVVLFNGQGQAGSVNFLSVQVPTMWAPSGEMQYRFVAHVAPGLQHALTTAPGSQGVSGWDAWYPEGS